MYSSYTDIIQIKSKKEILDLVNDENIPYQEINLDDSSNECRKRIDDAIAAADAEIDGYLRIRYSVPLSEAPVMIRFISRSLALETLFYRRMPDSMPESIVQDVKARRATLKDIAKGQISLGIEITDSKPAAGTYKTTKTASDRIFTNDLLDKY
jgi:phage gp36-like protein